MSIFVLKIIACITMFLDHIRYANPMFSNVIFQNLGRISFPLYAFMITEGYKHTSDIKKYYKRLIILAIVSQIPFMLFRKLVGEWKLLNIIFTLLLGMLCITVCEKNKKSILALCISACIIVLGNIIKVDYGWYGVAMVFIFYLGKENKYILSILYTILTYSYFVYRKINIMEHKVYFACFFIPLILVLLYNGKKGKDMKKFFYAFYPVSLIVVYLVSLI